MHRHLTLLVATGLVLLPASRASAQYGPRGGGMGGEGFGGGRVRYPVPALPGAEIDGPPDTSQMRTIASLSDSQMTRYALAYDSLMVATKSTRDSVQMATDKMHARLDGGDRAAAQFYAELLMDLAKSLKSRQDKFDDRLRGFLTGDQLKAYKRWEEDAQRAAQQRNRAEALRWQEPSGFSGSRNIYEERRGSLQPAGVVAPDLGSQAVRVGRTLYVAAQTALDSAGTLVGGPSLAAQAAQAFRNLTTVLKAADATPGDVVRLTIYVVNYDAKDLAVIRDAGGAFFSGRDAPTVTLLGVQSLSRPDLLVSIEATAVTRGGVQ